MATNDYFTRKASYSARQARPGASTLQSALGTPTSPRTPRTPLLGRSISGQFGSPGSFRVEQDECLVYALDPRTFKVGFAGEPSPRCIMTFGPDDSRRVGDYRQHELGYSSTRRKRKRGQEWGQEYELYRLDLREVDLGLVEDRLERAVRTAHSAYLMLSDARPKKVVLTVPPLLPTSLLDTVLKVCFRHHSQPPSVTLLPSPMAACISAGVRSAFVVDVGWDETVASAIYEYRSVTAHRTIRGVKLLTQHMAKMLEREAAILDPRGEVDELSFDEADQVVRRMGWCKDRVSAHQPSMNADNIIALPLPKSKPPIELAVPFSRFAEPAETAIFASNQPDHDHDDHELPLHLLAYRALLALSLDARAVCMSRIIVTGSAGNLPGLKHRLLQELDHLIKTRGWDPVNRYGSAAAYQANVTRERSANVVRAPRYRPPNRTTLLSSPTKTAGAVAEPQPVAAAFAPHDDTDHVSTEAEHNAAKGRVNVVRSVLRGVDSLGDWAGASLFGAMRAKGAVEVERDEFLKRGIDEVALLV